MSNRQTLSAQVERYSDVLPELAPLYPDHWAELALDTEYPEAALAPRWDQYLALEAAGELLVVTLRDLGTLAGYCLMVIRPHLHYEMCLTATTDIFRVLPQYRGRYGGARLFKAVEKECRRRGVKRMFVGSKLHRDSSRLFTSLGFKPIEIYHSKWLEN